MLLRKKGDWRNLMQIKSSLNLLFMIYNFLLFDESDGSANRPNYDTSIPLEIKILLVSENQYLIVEIG